MKSLPTPWWLWVFLALAALAIALGGYSFLQWEERQLRERVEDELSALAQAKVEQIADWRAERLTDAASFSGDPLFADSVAEWFESGQADLAAAIRARFETLQFFKQYRDINLVDAAGQTRLGLLDQTGPLDAEHLKTLTAAFQAGQPVFQDLTPAPLEGGIELAVVAPLFDAAGQPLGAVLLELDPRQFLYPLIQTWPRPSASAEIALVRREGDQVLWLNELRFQPDAALKLRLPLTRQEVAAVMAVNGQRGVVTSRDYREVEVFAALTAVPDSPWFLVAKEDRAEALAPLRTTTGLVLALMAGLLASVAGGLSVVWQQAQKRHFQAVYAAQTALRASEDRYRQITANMVDLVAQFDAQAVLQYASPSYERVLGYQPEELIGRWAPRLIHPDDSQAAMQAIIAMFHSGSGSVQFRYRHKDGRYLWFESTGRHLLDAEGKVIGAVIGSRDITSRKQAEAQSRLNEARLSSLYRITQYRAPSQQQLLDYTLEEAILLTSSQYGYIYYYDEIKEEFLLNAWSKEVMPDCTVTEPQTLYALSKTGLWGEAVRQRRPIMVNDFQTAHPLKKGYPEGHVALFRFLTIPLFANERIVAVVGVANKGGDYDEDDTRQLTLLMDSVWKIVENQRAEAALRAERAQLAQRVEEQTAALRLANAELLRAGQLKDEFLASMSHELRTPLTGILGLTEVMEKEVYGPVNSEQLNVLQVVRQSGEHLLALISDILDLSKIEADRMELTIVPVAVEDVCRASLQFVRQLAHKKDLSLTFEHDRRLQLLAADSRRLKQMLVNLLGNAVKFTPEGGQIGLEVTGDPIRNEARFVVWDTGIGIAPEKQKLLFQPFVQLNGGLARQYEGAGLGLALTLRLAEMHAGRLELESAGEGRGCRFSLTLPWQLSDGQESAPPEARVIGRLPQPHGQPARILLVDDNPSTLMAVTGLLDSLAAHVITAQDGYEALALVEVHQLDLILMDVQMPGLDGLSVIRQLKAAPATAHIPVIALTALAMAGDRERCLAAGADDYLSKPVRRNDMARAIERLLTPIEALAA